MWSAAAAMIDADKGEFGDFENHGWKEFESAGIDDRPEMYAALLDKQHGTLIAMVVQCRSRRRELSTGLR